MNQKINELENRGKQQQSMKPKHDLRKKETKSTNLLLAKDRKSQNTKMRNGNMHIDSTEIMTVL